jgi:hypothetical protein
LQPQAEIDLDAAGLGLYYASVIKFKKKTFVHAAARLKAFGTICKLLGKNPATTTLKDFARIHTSHKKSPFKLWKYLQHRFSGPGSNANARLKVLYEEVKHIHGCRTPLIAKKAIMAKNEEIDRLNGRVESLLKAVGNFEHLKHGCYDINESIQDQGDYIESLAGVEGISTRPAPTPYTLNQAESRWTREHNAHLLALDQGRKREAWRPSSPGSTPSNRFYGDTSSSQLSAATTGE